jgi:hypothetical protein
MLDAIIKKVFNFKLYFMENKKFQENDITLDRLNPKDKFENLEEMVSVLGEDLVLKYIKLKGNDINNILIDKINTLDYDFLSLSAKFKDCEASLNKLNLTDIINEKDMEKIKFIENLSPLPLARGGNDGINILSKNEGFISIVKKAFKEIDNIDGKVNNTLEYFATKSRFGASSLENYWLENRYTMFNNFTSLRKNSGNINEITQSNENNSIMETIINTGKLFNIENNKIIIDIDKSYEIFGVIKNLILNIPSEQLIFCGKVIPSTLGSFILYKKISGLYANMLLKQEENLIKNMNSGTISETIRNRYFNELKDLQKINRLDLFRFNIYTMLVVGVFLTGFTNTLNKNLEWKIKLGKTEPLPLAAQATPLMGGESPPLSNINQSLIPLFIINKFKNFKRYFIFTFLGFILWRGLDFIYPYFLEDLVNKALNI